MKNRFLAGLAILTLIAAGALCLSVKAQTTEEGPGPSEQPSAPMEVGEPAPGPEAQPGPSGTQAAETDQGVGRISMIHGDVSTQRGDSGDWSAAALNQPVVNGDKVSTGAGGRAEVQFDYANLLRLSSNAQITVADLTKKHIQIQLGQGLVNYSVFKDSEAEPEIDTPNVAVHPSHRDGSFRIEVRPDGDTVIIVRNGEAQISTPQGSTEIKSGDMATVRGTSTDAQYKISDAPDRDDWDRWNSDRDKVIRNAQAWHHTNRYYTGSEDLDSYGRWENVQDYGDVWVPNEPDGWVPYRDGNWVWEPDYGWTWVGYEPWGWAPYHYGRWFWYGSAWAWWPGPVWGGYHPFWAPAYVSFWCWGGGWGFGLGWGGWGGFGWFPIGPCDRFFPWWGGWGGRFGVVNITNININRFGGIAPLHNGLRFSNLANLHNEHVARAMSTVGAGRFGAGPVRGTAATPAQIKGGRMITGNLPVTPTHASLSASGRPAAAGTIRTGGTEHFFGSHGAARPESFQQQTSRLQQSFQQNHVTPVQAGAARNETGSVGRGTPAMGTMQKPGAGTVAPNRENNSPGARNGGSAGAENGNRGGFRPFTPPSNGTMRQSGQPERSSGSMPSVNRGAQTPATRGEPNRSEWKPFTPPSRSAEPAGRGAGSSPAPRAPSQSYWNRTAPSSSYSREAGGYGRSSGSRPQLDMRQPIVPPRSSGSYGGYRGSPSYGGGARSAPSYGGYGGGSRAPSAPSHGGGGGYSGGGGGGHPSSGGGGGGGHPSGGGGGGGGSHSSGGGSHGGHR